MMELLKFTFQNGWHFFGMLTLLSVAGSFAVAALAAMAEIISAALRKRQ